MIVSEVRSAEQDGAVELSARVAFADAPAEGHRVWFRFADAFAPLPLSGDPFLAGLFVPCLMLGEDLRIEAPVSAGLVEAALTRTAPLLRRWHPHFAPVAIRADGAHAPPAGAPRGVAACFSAGVDSSYTLEKHRARITHLLTISGFDRSVDAEVPWRNVVTRVGEAAGELGMTPVLAHTNLRQVGRKEAQRRARRAGRLPENYFLVVYHGSMLVAVAHCLKHVVGDLLIPSSHSWDSLVPWGSHPELDRSWSCPGLAIDHDGCEADRIEKVRRLGQWNPERLRRISVCHDFWRTTARNCGRCAKCLLNLMVLRVNGLSQLADSFAEPLDLGRVARSGVGPLDRNRFLRLRRAAEAAGDQPLVAALGAALGWRARARRRLREGWAALAQARRRPDR